MGRKEKLRHLILSGKESRYTVIITWSDEDDSYITSVPDLPGCMADGKTKEEALQNTEVVIQEWIETAQKMNRPIPQPTYFGMATSA